MQTEDINTPVWKIPDTLLKIYRGGFSDLLNFVALKLSKARDAATGNIVGRVEREKCSHEGINSYPDIYFRFGADRLAVILCLRYDRDNNFYYFALIGGGEERSKKLLDLLGRLGYADASKSLDSKLPSTANKRRKRPASQILKGL